MNKAQAQLIREDFIKRFSSQYNVAARGIDAQGKEILTFEQQFPILEQILIRSGFDFNASIVKNLEDAGSVSTGALTEVSNPQVTSSKNGYNLSVGYPLDSKQLKYYDFVNKGVAGYNGKNSATRGGGKYQFKSPFPNRKMAAAIFSWLNKARKSLRTEKLDLSAVQKKRRKLGTQLNEAANKRSLAYAISRSIKREGIKSTYYFDRAIEENFTQNFKDALSVALGGDIILQIRQYGNNNSK